MLEPGQTINADILCQQLDQVNQALIENYPGHLDRKDSITQQGNARSHSARKTLNKIKELGWKIFPHPPYLSDIALSDYHLLRLLQYFLSGKKVRKKS